MEILGPLSYAYEKAILSFAFPFILIACQADNQERKTPFHKRTKTPASPAVGPEIQKPLPPLSKMPHPSSLNKGNRRPEMPRQRQFVNADLP